MSEGMDWSVAAEALAAATRHLKRSEARFRAVLESVVDPLLVLREDLCIVELSRSTEGMFGAPVDELYGTHFDDLVDPAWREANPQALAQAWIAVRTQPSYELEVACVRRDGSTFACEVSLARAPLSRSSESLYVVALQDLSVRRNLQEQLLHAQKMEAIGQLAAGVAHELNTPIQFVGDNLTFLAEALPKLLELIETLVAVSSPSDAQPDAREAGANPSAASAADKVQRLIEEIDLEFLAAEIPLAIAQSKEGMRRVSDIVRAMRDFSHPGGAEMGDVDVNRSLQSTVIVSRNEWRHVAQVDLDLDPELPTISAFSNELHQVFLNLVVNAAHAIGDARRPGAPALGRIRIQTHSEPGWICVRISDDGVGMPSHVRERIFEPFFTTKPVGRGTGQGLSIAYRIVVQHHGGRIQVESEAGKGTTFGVWLPRRAVGPSAEPAAPTGASSAPTREAAGPVQEGS